MKVRTIASIAVGLPLVVLACVGQPERLFYDDLDGASDVTAPDAAADVTTAASGDGAPEVSPPVDDAIAMQGDDAGDDAALDAGATGDGASADANDGAAPDAALDGSGVQVEAGCGPIDTTAQCGACNAACDTSHGTPTECAAVGGGDASTCVYGSCNQGWGDCVMTAPNTNGCETALTTPANCGGCGVACDTTHSTSPGCDAGAVTCVYGGCAMGFADCVQAAPNTNGCETPTNTTSNCSGCGIACDTAHSYDAGCTGTSCTYTGCKAGWINCNPAAPNAGGCACNTPTCCGTSCQTTHANGLGQSFYDCNPLGSVNSSVQAFAACTAYTGSQTKCTGSLTCAGFPTVGPYVCNKGTGSACTRCWAYGGTDVGMVEDCNCPGTDIGTWN